VGRVFPDINVTHATMSLLAFRTHMAGLAFVIQMNTTAQRLASVRLIKFSKGF